MSWSVWAVALAKTRSRPPSLLKSPKALSSTVLSAATGIVPFLSRSASDAGPTATVPVKGLNPKISPAILPVVVGAGDVTAGTAIPLHVRPGLSGCEHWPVAGAQTPGLWQESRAVQVSLLPTHAPD